MIQSYTVAIEFASTRGNNYTRHVTIRARSTQEAKNFAWARLSPYGGRDNATACYVIKGE